MGSYEFNYENNSYVLNEEKCSYFLNFEELPVEGIDVSHILKALKDAEEVSFGMEYYDQPCGKCKAGVQAKEKYFKFLEYHFFILTKNNQYVLSNIAKEYKNTSYKTLQKKGLVDDSYLVSLMVCPTCGDYSVEIEQCEI